jgi:hypothetical protein
MDNPDITASDIITDVEGRFSSSPSLSASRYIPWISYAYQKVYQAIISVNQTAKEEIFGTKVDISLNTNTPNEYSLETEIPRFGGFIDVQIKYGATGDTYNRAKRLKSMSHWTNWDNISTTYRSKLEPLYYKLGDTLGFIPVPPESGATAKVFYVKRSYQITEEDDVIELPYRFLYLISDYVHARALQAVNEDYATAGQIENNFRSQLEDLKEAVASEFNENDGTDAIQRNDDDLFTNPLDY